MTETLWCLILNGGTCSEYCRAIRDAVPPTRYESIRDKMLNDFMPDDEEGNGRVRIYVETARELIKIAEACLVWSPEICATLKSESGGAGASISHTISGHFSVNRDAVNQHLVEAAIAARDALNKGLGGIAGRR